jgi:RHS repeat-associated protein
VTDQNQNLVQTLDFYPYGATRVSVSTSTNEKRKFISQFLDDSNLEYLNARYYNPAQGQFISQDPVFWELGLTNDGKAALTNPQSQNSYGYASDNPITNKDPSGRIWWEGFYDWRGYNGWQGVLMKAGEVLGGHDRALNAMQTYQGTINADSQKYGVNLRLTNAIVYEEQSHLMPDEALGREQLFPNIGNGGVGVMQVSGPIGKKFGNYSKTDLARDPLKNIDAGTAYLSSIQNTFSSPTRYEQTTGIGAAYNGSSAYVQRIAAQASSPNYNRNVFVAGLQSLVSSLQKLISTLQK